MNHFVALPATEHKLPNVTAITVTSPNAIKHTPHHFISKFPTIPVYAVGQETAIAKHIRKQIGYEPFKRWQEI